MSESLYNRWMREVGHNAAHAIARRRVLVQSERLRALAAKSGYRPPGVRALPDRLYEIRRAIREPVERAAAEAARPAARREELTRLLGDADDALEAVSCYDSPEHVEGLLRRREALRFLLKRVPPVAAPVDALSLAALVAEAVDAEVGRLREWRALLKEEHGRIRVEVEEFERESVTAAERRGALLKQDLADVMQAEREADDNLRLKDTPSAMSTRARVTSSVVRGVEPPPRETGASSALADFVKNSIPLGRF